MLCRKRQKLGLADHTGRCVGEDIPDQKPRAHRISSRPHIGNRRLLKNFVRYNEARAYADEQVAFLLGGKLGVAVMRDADRESFVAAVRLLQPLDMPCSTPCAYSSQPRRRCPLGLPLSPPRGIMRAGTLIARQRKR